jgi:pilus assembly protein CpaE
MNDDRSKVEGTLRVESGLKVLIIGREAAEIGRIEAALAAAGASVEDSHDDGVDEILSAVAKADPDVLFLRIPEADSEALDCIDRIEHLYPSVTCVLQCNDQSPQFLMRAMRAGVREVLPIAAEVDSIIGAVGHVAAKRAQRVRKEGKVLAFLSCKGGGGGATFIATNLAYALAAIEEQKVILIDLNLQWGDAAFFLSDKKPSTTLADVATQIQRLDASFLDASVVKPHENLAILAAPEDPLHAMDVKPEHLDVLLRLARANYDFVILDAGRALDAVTVRAFDYADTIFPVLQMTVPFVRDGRRLTEAFRSLAYGQDKVRLIVNRYEKGGDIRLAELEKAIGRKVFRTLPNDYEVVAESINQGVPVVKLSHGSAISRAIREFAHELVPVPAKQSGGWFTRVLGHGSR